MSLQGKTILVVDDEADIRELVVSEFEFSGAQCLEASSGRQAFELYKTNHIDAVVSDIRMPDGDGMYFLDQVRDAKMPFCSMIFITGYSDIPLEEFYDRGVEAILTKPFRLEQLVQTLDMALHTPRLNWRRAPRLVTSLKVEVTWGNLPAPLSTKTFTVGRGGMFVQLDQAFPEVGTQVQFLLTFDTDGNAEVLPGQMVVRWRRTEPTSRLPSGVGCEFVGMSESELDRVADAIGLARSQGFIPKA